MLAAVADGVTMTTWFSAANGPDEFAVPLIIGPTIAWTPSTVINFLVLSRPLAGSVLSLSSISWICLPSTPPAALISFAASLAPSSIFTPMAPRSPVRLRLRPILMGVAAVGDGEGEGDAVGFAVGEAVGATVGVVTAVVVGFAVGAGVEVGVLVQARVAGIRNTAIRRNDKIFLAICLPPIQNLTVIMLSELISVKFLLFQTEKFLS